MNTDKLNELIGEVIHLASAAELASDEQIKIQAIGDIYDAIASVLPVDHARLARGASPTVPNATMTAANKTRFRSIICDLEIVATADVMGRKFCAEAGWEVENNKLFKEGFVGYVSEKHPEKGWHMARIEFNPKVGCNACRRILHGILSGISSHYGHKSRKKANRRARLALTVKEG